MILCGIGLVLGYALLGAGWLVLKSEDALRSWARGRIPMLTGAVVAVLCIAVVIAFFDRARMTGSLFLDRPWGFIFPLIGIIAIVGVFAGVLQGRDAWPFTMTVVLFVAAFLSLAVMFWPYMIPYNITMATAAAPEASLSFLFWGADLFVLPVIGAYTKAVYWAFRGKQRAPPIAVRRS
jgi:cytochrome bd ubiquinol oxidase subunit II